MIPLSPGGRKYFLRSAQLGTAFPFQAADQMRHKIAVLQNPPGKLFVAEIGIPQITLSDHLHNAAAYAVTIVPEHRIAEGFFRKLAPGITDIAEI